MLPGGAPESGPSFRVFWWTLFLFNLALIAAGVVYAAQHAIPAAVAAPVIAAFVVEASFFLVPGFPEVRTRLERHFELARLALLLLGASLVPYLIYSIPCGVFSWPGFAFLAALCFLVSHVYVWAPARSDALCWQDVLVLAALAYPMVSGLGSPFEAIYPSPSAEVPPLDVLGKLMLVPLGAMAFLSVRRLSRTGYRFFVSREDFVAGVRNFLWFIPLGAPLAIGIGFVQWGPKPIDNWTYPFEFAGNALGLYLVVALAEEMYFRGVLQNLLTARLGRPQTAQLITSVLFGLSHLGRGFPNWRYATVASVAGWFYGRAYSQRQSVVASAVTHTLVNLARRFLFL